MSCAVIEIAHIIGKKWAVPVIEEIAYGKFSGFNEFLRKAKNMTPRILSKQLKDMEDVGLITKKQRIRDSRRTTEYTLTEKGVEFYNIIKSIKEWGTKWSVVPSYCANIPCTECPKYKSR